MQRRNRDIVIFNLSAIDLFCSGMGAVMVLMMLLLPYYMRKDSKPIEKELAAAVAKAAQDAREAEKAKAALASVENRNRALEEANRQQSAKLSQPCLAVAISWETTDADIDLHIIDPDGRHYSFDNETNPGSEAVMEVDSVRGPGNELWLHPKATAGVYKVRYHYYGGAIAPTEVRGVAVHQGGRLPLKTISLSSKGQQSPFQELVVANDGTITLR